MGDFLHSERMTLCQIFVPSEAAYFVVSELGEIGVVQFRDLNKDVTAFQRNFVEDVRRCHEMERKLRHIRAEIETHEISVDPFPEIAKALPPNEIAQLELHISRSEEELKRLSQNAHSLRQSFLELQQLKHVLEKTETFLRKRDEVFGFDGTKNMEDLRNSSIMNQLNVVTGIISRERVKSFETMLWRVSKGNAYFERVDIEEPLQDFNLGTKEYKTVFIIFFHGSLLTPRVNKICEGFRANLYTCPMSYTERKKLLENITRRLDDINVVIKQTYSFRESFLNRVAKDLSHWSTMVGKIKAIFHVLNFLNMDITGKCLIGQCWVPYGNISAVKKALADGSRASGCPIFSFLYVVRTDEEPPTYHKTNKFTKCFQKMVDLYGVSSYREVNPALFSIVTFPFLFAVMFGDAGHALILVLTSTLMIRNEKKLSTVNNEILNIFFFGRYLLLLMGIFSLYTGLVYNEVFSKSVNIFGSSWRPVNETTAAATATLHPERDYIGTPYILGVDPIWDISTNRITFLNSYKMKMSIIFGVLHMILGLFSNVINYVCCRKYVYIFLDFLPKLCLLCCLFLWLVAMMFIKWILFSADSKDTRYGTSCAPSILIQFINMILVRKTKTHEDCNLYLFQSQPQLQRVLMILSLVAIVVLLIGKPIYEMIVHRHRADKHFTKQYHDELSLKFHKSVDANLNVEGESDGLTDFFITEIIHTIEYVLGTISHTASYLRLWALSLAHSELSHILWSRVLCSGMQLSGFGGGLALFFSFFFWAFFTITILVLMEGLSAFLHTLRLHWVEFMSKFYEGRGYSFEPFSFKEILEHQNEKLIEEEEEDEEQEEDMDHCE